MIESREAVDEKNRLAALRALGLLDTAPEERFDRLTRLAQRLFDVPMAAISLVDAQRVWFKSRQGLNACEMDRSSSLCGYAVRLAEPLVVPDASLDPRFKDSPPVASENGLRFYAGCQLRASDGSVVAVFCVGDIKPRAMTADDLRSLRDLAALAEREMGDVTLNEALAEVEADRRLLGESEERYRALYVGSRDAIMITNPKKGFVGGNPATLRMFGCRDEREFTTQSPANLSPEFQPDGQSSSAKAQEMMGIAAERGTHFFEWTHRRMDGTEFPATVLLSMIEIGGQAILQATVRDITLEKRLESRMIQSAKLSAVGSLAAGVAHEINNPLGVILGFAQALAGGIQAGEASFGPIKAIEREALRCKALVQELLVFSRQGKGHVEDFDLDQAVAHALALVQPQARVKGVTLTNESGPAGTVRGDRGQLQQVVVNLAVNAIDAMPQGGRLAVRTWRTGVSGDRKVLLRVEDTGTGISAALLTKIFEPFFTTKPVGKGTGLGLALVHEIVAKHGGTVEVDSFLGKGTVFTVALPAGTENGRSPEAGSGGGGA